MIFGEDEFFGGKKADLGDDLTTILNEKTVSESDTTVGPKDARTEYQSAPKIQSTTRK
jgi:hypothetical protein